MSLSSALVKISFVYDVFLSQLVETAVAPWSRTEWRCDDLQEYSESGLLSYTVSS